MANFKQYDRTQRNLTTEQDFSKGMYYTNQPLTDGAWKTMVNYDIDLTGTSVHPRPGMVVKQDRQYEIPEGYRLHHNGSLILTSGYSDIFVKYTLLYNSITQSLKLVDDEGVHTVDNKGLWVRIKDNSYSENIHGLSVASLRDVPQPNATQVSIGVLLGEEGLIKLMGSVDDALNRSYWLEQVEPRVLTISEAAGMGYNMLQPEPYEFTDRANQVGIATFNYLGIAVMDLQGNTLVHAKRNTPVKFRAYYESPPNWVPPSGFKVQWEFRDVLGGSPSVVRVTNHLTEIEHTCTFEYLNVTVTLFTSDNTPLAFGGLDAEQFHAKDTEALEPIKYNLLQASGLTSWQRRLVLWGTPGGANVIFIGDVEAVNYFPYPHSAINDIEGRVLRCVPFMNDLLIFTESKLYRASIKVEGGFTVKLVQDHLQMTEFEASTVVTVKNMVFFKSGNYYYMVVPKVSTGDAGELQLAPISTAITDLLGDFYKNISHIFFSMFGDITIRDIVFCGYTNFQDNGTVKNIYKFTVDGLYFDLYLNYSTVLRTWTLYIMQSTEHNISINKGSVTYQTEYSFIDGDSFKIITPDRNVVADEHMQDITFQNLQMLDTGHREQNSQFKKRYREVQFKINNISKKAMQFGTEFRLDEQTRKGLFKYNIEHDGESLVVVPEFLDVITDAGQTVLEENDTMYIKDVEYITPSEIVELKTNHWQLDVSTLWDVSIKKIRLKVSGKGYSPRLVLISLNLEPYELMNFNWVYRTMHGR